MGAKVIAALVLALGVLLASPAESAITRVSGQVTSPACVGGDVTLTLPGAVTPGNLVVITAVLQGAMATATITGNDFAFTAVGPATHGTEALRAYQWWGIGGTDNSWTVDNSSTVSMCAFAIEYTGNATVSVADVNCSGEGTTTSHVCGSSATQTSAGVIVSIVRSTSTAAFTAGTGYTRQDTWADTTRSAVEDKITSTPESFDGAWTSSASETTLMFAVSYKEAAGAVTGRTLSMMGVGQ